MKYITYLWALRLKTKQLQYCIWICTYYNTKNIRIAFAPTESNTTELRSKLKVY